jgi:hypothetical protein
VGSKASPHSIQFGYGTFMLRLTAERAGEIIEDLRRQATPYGDTEGSWRAPLAATGSGGSAR